MTEWASLAVLVVCLLFLVHWLAAYSRFFPLLQRIQGWAYAGVVTALLFAVLASAAMPQQELRREVERMEQRVDRQEARFDTLVASFNQQQIAVAGRLSALESSLNTNSSILTAILISLILMILGGVARFLWGVKAP